MLIMKNKEKILQMTEENKGFVTNTQINKLGISPGSLKYLVDMGALERVSRGLYVLPGVAGDKLYGLQTRYKKGIFSEETALFLHKISGIEPERVHMTFPISYHTQSLLTENIKYHRVKEDYDSGVVTLKTAEGNPVRVYRIERTLCDILKERNHTDVYVIAEAFKQYLSSEHTELELLFEYAKKFRVEKKLNLFLKNSVSM